MRKWDNETFEKTAYQHAGQAGWKQKWEAVASHYCLIVIDYQIVYYTSVDALVFFLVEKHPTILNINNITIFNTIPDKLIWRLKEVKGEREHNITII